MVPPWPLEQSERIVAPWLLLKGSAHAQRICCLGHPPHTVLWKWKEGFAWWTLALSPRTLAISIRNKWPGIGTLGYKHFLSWWLDNGAITVIKSLLGTSWARLVQPKCLFQILCHAAKHWKWARSCLHIWKAHRTKKEKKQNQKSLFNHHSLRYLWNYMKTE